MCESEPASQRVNEEIEYYRNTAPLKMTHSLNQKQLYMFIIIIYLSTFSSTVLHA